MMCFPSIPMTSLSELWFYEINQSPLILPAFITHWQSCLPSEDSHGYPFIIIPVISYVASLCHVYVKSSECLNKDVMFARDSYSVCSAEKPNSSEEAMRPKLVEEDWFDAVVTCLHSALWPTSGLFAIKFYISPVPKRWNFHSSNTSLFCFIHSRALNNSEQWHFTA